MVKLILTWSANCARVYTNVANENPTFVITETKSYAPVVTLSFQGNTELLQQLKPQFKRTNNRNKDLSIPELLAQNPNFNHLVQASFSGVNTLFVLAFEEESEKSRTVRKINYLPNVEVRNYNVMIDGIYFFINQ